MIYDNILELIGKTPLIKYNENICLKLEFFNPSGSIKDRASYCMIKNAIDRGDINKNTVIIEPTSGNTGIGLAMVCAVLGLKLIICMPENMSEERKKSIAAYGAELVLTPKSEGMKGSVDKATKLSKKYTDSFIPMQFSNMDNAYAHKYTAQEIFNDTNGQVDIVVAGIGTGGTAIGLKKYLTELKADTMVFGVEPEENPLFTKGYSGIHKVQGIGANFIPDICKDNILDGVIAVNSDKSIAEAINLAKNKGIFVGISSGANLLAAKELSKTYPNKKIVAIMPDGGDRYLSVW